MSLQNQVSWVKVQLIVSSICFTALAYVLLVVIARLLRLRQKTDLHWTQRRIILVLDGVVLLVFQFILTATSIASCIYFLTDRCSWFDTALNVLAFFHEFCLDVVCRGDDILSGLFIVSLDTLIARLPLQLLAWMCIMVRAMTPVIAKPAVEESGPSEFGRRRRSPPKLLFDMPWRKQLLWQAPLIIFFLMNTSMTLLRIIYVVRESVV